MQKRILAIHDISCYGRCSLTAALPIISACGCECTVMPTAVLSTHTGGFNGYTFTDLTRELLGIAEHWKTENITFDGIYTGYLGSFEQISKVMNIFDTFGKNILKIVDPVMADNGKLYPGFDLKFAHQMASLCSHADIIVPNLTEACFMLDIPYVEYGTSREYVKYVLRKLTNLGCKKAVLTGISFDPNKLGCVGYDSETDTFFEYFNDKIPQKYHGTGDIYSSVFVGGLMNGLSLEHSASLAADFVCDSIIATRTDEKPIHYGVHFEKVIPSLCDRLRGCGGSAQGNF